jgi:hypothetical protein
VYALRGDREWKRGPRDTSSPLVIETWKLLKREGVQTAAELQGLLGREVTEAAVLRALSELWTALRILPVYTAGEATSWELFESRHLKAMQVGGGMAQATALSALVSLYLDSVVAATTEEIETFLSPLAPRSRVGEVARGLAATQQLNTQVLGTHSLLYITGGLPEFPEIEAPAEAAAETTATSDAAPQVRERRKPFAPRSGTERRPPRDGERKPFTPGDRTRSERPAFGERPAARGVRKPTTPGWKRPDSDGPRKEWKPRREASAGGFSKPYRSRTGGQDTGGQAPGEKFPPREGGPQRPPRKEWKPREGATEGRREFRPRPAVGGKSFSKPSYRSRTGDQPGGPRGERPAGKFPPRDGSQRPPRKEWKPRSDVRPSAGRPAAGRKEWKPREDAGTAGRSEFRPRRSAAPGERGTFKPRPASGGAFRPRREEGGSSGRPKPAGEKRSFAKRPFEGRAFEGREGADRKKPPQRERRAGGQGGLGAKPAGKSFSKPAGRPGGKPGGRFGAPKAGKKSSFGAKRSSRPGGKPAFGKKPRGKKKSGE